ncbi:MAG: hypothetical protein HOH74_02790 [Gemmatimonadetes bacterium]|nr:hypothetical protein [Gemmatimonadota bacterium]
MNQPLEELRQKLGAAFDDEMLQQLREHAARANIIPVPHAFETRVQRYDFKHPARLNKTQMRTLENLHENFARLLGSTFSAAMRQVVNVDTAFVDQTTYREFIMSLSNPSSSYQFTLAPRHGQVIMDIAMPVSFALVDSAHGGKGSSAGLDARQLSQLEMGVLAKVVRRAVEDLEATWEGVMPEVNIHDIELETNPEFMQIAPGNEIVLLLAFEVNTPNVSALISLCYPFFTLEPIMHRFGVQTYGRRSDRDRRATRQENRLRLGGMELPVVAELGRAKVATKEAASLQVGDVVRLQTRADEPACVYLGGRPKFHGYPYAEQGRLQLQIAGRVPPQFAEGYGQVRALDVPEIPERRTVRVLRP